MSLEEARIKDTGGMLDPLLYVYAAVDPLRPDIIDCFAMEGLLPVDLVAVECLLRTEDRRRGGAQVGADLCASSAKTHASSTLLARVLCALVSGSCCSSPRYSSSSSKR